MIHTPCTNKWTIQNRNICYWKWIMDIMNKAAMNIFGQLSLRDITAYFGFMPKSITAGSWGRNIPSFLRKQQIDFQSGCTTLYSNQQWISIPLAPHPPPHVLCLEFFILAILMGVRRNVIIALICISLIT